jgi:pyridinium-3,5-biscarboxylic acid mononucleotide sulfurtransferase
MQQQEEKRYDELLKWFPKHTPILVAFSGGVDSAFVLKAAVDALGSSQVIALTADSPSLPKKELENAKNFAIEISAKHIITKTKELELKQYRQNLGNRCFYCKTSLYKAIEEILTTNKLPFSSPTIIDGTNKDDLADIRPGHLAAKEAGVRHPLVELNFSKDEIRQLSSWLNLSVANKPAMACLSSRIPPGTEVTAEKLALIEQAEEVLYKYGFTGFRLRYHELNPNNSKSNSLLSISNSQLLARIELPEEEFEKIFTKDYKSLVSTELRNLGFSFVTIDLEGYRKGGRAVINKL